MLLALLVMLQTGDIKPVGVCWLREQSGGLCVYACERGTGTTVVRRDGVRCRPSFEIANQEKDQ